MPRSTLIAVAHAPAATGRALFGLLLAGLIGCGGTEISETPVDVSGLDATASATIVVGLTTQLSATPKSASGAALTARSVAWTSDKESVVRVSPQGVATGVAIGVATVTATSGAAHQDIPITVVPGSVASLRFATQPTSTVAGATLTSIQVQLVDGLNNITTSNAGVVITLTGGASDGVLAGRVSGSAQSGLATFGDLSIARKGTGYRLVATSGGLQATSNAFDIAAGPPASMNKSAGDAATTIAGTATAPAPSVRILDAQGNGVPDVAVTFAATSGGGLVGGAAQNTNADGTATAGSWTLGPNMGPNTLVATAGSLATTFSATGTGGPTPGIRFVAGALGSAATQSIRVGQDIAVPLTLDLTNRGADDLASLAATITWDPSQLTFKNSNGGNWVDALGAAASITINSADVATGTLRVAAFTPSETLKSFVLTNLVFTTTAAGTSPIVTLNVVTAGNGSGGLVSLVTRPLTVTVTP